MAADSATRPAACACSSRICCRRSSASGATHGSCSEMNRSSSGTQNGSARIAGWSLVRAARPRSPGDHPPASRANSSTMPRSCPGASTNVGWSWTADSSSTAGGAGLPASSAATQRLAAWLDPSPAAVRRRSPATTRASAAGSRRPGTPWRARAARWAGARYRRAAGTPERRAGRRPRSFRARCVARSSQRSNWGSTDPRSSSASSSAIGTASAWTAASATEPAGPSSSSSPRACASARASGACSASIRIQWRPRRSRRSSTSWCRRRRDPGVRAPGPLQLGQRVMGVVGETQPGVALQARAQDLGRRPIQRQSPRSIAGTR